MDPATIMAFLGAMGNMGGGKDKKKEAPKQVNINEGNEGYLANLQKQNSEREMAPLKMLIKKREKVEDHFS